MKKIRYAIVALLVYSCVTYSMHRIMKSNKIFGLNTRHFRMSRNYVPNIKPLQTPWYQGNDDIRKRTCTQQLIEELAKPVADINFERAVFLVQCGADPSIPTQHDNIRLLQLLVGRPQYNNLTNALLDHYPQLVHDVCITGSGPLHNAARIGNVPVLKKLIACGAQVNKQDSYGYTPLHTLAYFNPVITGKTARIALLLKKYGADVTILNYDHTPRTPADIAKDLDNQILYDLLRPTNTMYLPLYTDNEK